MAGGNLPFGLVPSGELTAYVPTLRERAADWLRKSFYSDDREGQRRAEKVTNVAEFTPFGLATGMYDAVRAGGEGDYTGAALNMAMAGIPGPNPKGIRAFHGSPHDFDRFDMSKIGTGEGAQAYGHGLYFAESEGVAKSYRDRLKSGDNNSIVHIGDREFPSDMGNYYLRQETERLVPVASTNFVSGKETYDYYNKELGNAAFKALKRANHSEDPVAVMSAAMDETIANLAPYEDELPSVLAMKQATLEYARNNIRLSPNGRMYEVRINADPDAFLDWDKPLPPDHKARSVAEEYARLFGLNNTNPQIRNRAKDAVLSLSKPELTGEGAHNIIRDMLGSDKYSKAAAANALYKEAGIPGIKYLDAGSRTKGDGSHNYVVFDDKLVEILRKYGWAGILPFGLSAMNTDEAQAAP